MPYQQMINVSICQENVGVDNVKKSMVYTALSFNVTYLRKGDPIFNLVTLLIPCITHIVVNTLATVIEKCKNNDIK